MNNIEQLTIIGGGAMGSAIARGLIKGSKIRPENLIVIDHNKDKLTALANELGVVIGLSLESAPKTDAYLIAIKPHAVVSLLSSMTEELRDALLISIAAGITNVTLEKATPESTRVVRVMPNVNAEIGESMSLVAGGSRATEEDVDSVVNLFEGVGSALALSESLLDVGGAISGSGPAYMALIIDNLTTVGVKRGLKASVARRIALETMRGTADLLLASEKHPRVLMEEVASPGGTTIIALSEMTMSLEYAFEAAINAALNRSSMLAEEE